MAYTAARISENGGTPMKHHPSWTALRSYAITAGLACLMGVSYELFVFPNAFAPAGINGLATMLQYLLHVNIGYLSLLINLPLVLLAWKKVDRDFARKTLVFVLVFSAVTLVLGQMDLSAIAYDSGSSAILGPVAAGVVSGAVYGWVIRQNGSTGGTDIVAAWVRKKHPEASLVWLIFSLNAAVAVLSFFVYGCQFEPVILCLIYWKDSIRDDRRNRYYFYLNLAGLVLYTCGSFIPEVSRVAYYLIQSQIFLIPGVLWNAKKGWFRNLCIVGVIAAYLLYFVMLLRGMYDVEIRLLPYLNWIFN